MEKVSGVLGMTMAEMLFFGIDNGSSSHTDNRKSIFLILGEGNRKFRKYLLDLVILSLDKYL